MGYSIKSDLGMPPTLLNPSGATNFQYELIGNFNEENIERKASLQNLKKRRICFNSFSPSPFSLKKENINKITCDNNDNLDSFIDKEYNNNTPSSNFNYKDNFENLKKRMTNLIENLFDLIELQKNKSQ